MVKVQAGRVDGFVSGPDPAIAVHLIYGPNSGLVRERVETLCGNLIDDPSDPFRTAELTSAAVAESPARLADEVLALSFDGGQRLVVVRDGADALAKPLEDALAASEGAASRAAVVIEAGDLSARSGLRKLCESRADCAALPCYADDEAGRADLARRMLSEANISILPDALRTLTGILGDDRLGNRREIEKLVLYVGAGGTADEDAVIAAVGDTGVVSLDDTVYAALDGDLARLDRAVERYWAEGGEPVGLVRAMQRHLQRMHRVAYQLEQGTSYDQAAKRLRPPVFWKVAKAFERQCRSWPRERIELAIGRLTEAELAIKSTGTPATAACGRTLYAIARMTRTNRR
jgi:DNA polymerase-3 subunit delta